MASCVFVAACGDDEETSSSGGQSAESTPAAEPIKVGLVTDIGGLNDRSFNQLANEGLERAKSELGIEGRVVISEQNSDYVPNLASLAQQQYDLVIGVGFLMAEAMNTAASQFPDTKFAIIDVDATMLESKPTNVAGLLFKEQEAGYLVGYMAGLFAADNDGAAVSSVGGEKIPPVDRYIAGFQAGATAANPDVETPNEYSQDFVDQAKCKELALNQISQGSVVVFQVAGQCGLGVLDAAKEESQQAIGVDADQGYLGEQVMTSALKKVDVAVFEAVKSVQEDTYKGGANTVFDVKSGGVGIGETNEAGAMYAEQVQEIQDQIASGELTDIPEEVQ